MIKGKYGAVIGWRTQIFVCARSEFPGDGLFSQLYSATFPLWSSCQGVSPDLSMDDSRVVDPSHVKLRVEGWSSGAIILQHIWSLIIFLFYFPLHSCYPFASVSSITFPILRRALRASTSWVGDERAETTFHRDHYENMYCVVRLRTVRQSRLFIL